MATTTVTDHNQVISGGPFLQTWPTGNSGTYLVAVATGSPAGLPSGVAGTVASGVTPNAGDVLVAKAGSSPTWYDATQNPSGTGGACATALG